MGSFSVLQKRILYYDMLPSLYYTNQAYGALNKCWLGFVIAKEKGEWDKLEMYARRIQKLERQLGREVMISLIGKLNKPYLFF